MVKIRTYSQVHSKPTQDKGLDMQMTCGLSSVYNHVLPLSCHLTSQSQNAIKVNNRFKE